MAYGDPADTSNPFHWDHICLNLLGSPSYQPHLPWVHKIIGTGCLAEGSNRYVDDLCTVSRSLDYCWRIGHWIATTFTFLGLQKALQKFWAPIQHPEPLADWLVLESPALRENGKRLGALSPLSPQHLRRVNRFIANLLRAHGDS
jgi:hypothetical protein